MLVQTGQLAKAVCYEVTDLMCQLGQGINKGLTDCARGRAAAWLLPRMSGRLNGGGLLPEFSINFYLYPHRSELTREQN